MVAGIFLVSRSSQGLTDDRNRIRAVIINNDDADATAVIQANAVAALNAAHPSESGAEALYPAGYFDASVQFAAAPEGPLATDQDFLAYAPEVVSVRT